MVRHYKVYVPPTYDPRVPTPLLYMLAGFTIDMYSLAAYTQLARTADLNGFILVYPQQPFENYGAGLGWVFAWYSYSNGWEGGQWPDNPDVDFIRALTAHLKTLYNVDRTRIFSSGHSRGAAMSITLAFELPDTIAGFISESGFLSTGRAEDYDARLKALAGLRRKIPAALMCGVQDADVGVASTDYMRDTFKRLGWTEGSDFIYYRLESVGHEWQPQYNQQFWDFMRDHPLPLEMAAP